MMTGKFFYLFMFVNKFIDKQILFSNLNAVGWQGGWPQGDGGGQGEQQLVSLSACSLLLCLFLLTKIVF